MEGSVLLPGSPRDKRSIPLATRAGNHIPNERRREMAPDRLKAAVALWARERPLAHLRSITATYNCVGMAFANRRTWVDPSSVPRILADDGYRRVERPASGDIVLYRTDDGALVHIAVVLEARKAFERWNLVVLSQWGADGEYVHPENYVPDRLGRPVEYWTERVEAL